MPYNKKWHATLLLLVLHSLPLYRQVSSLLTSEVNSVRAGRHLATKLNILVQQHFDLASTTITNIPMKVRLLSSSSPMVQAFTSPIYNLSPFSLTPTHTSFRAVSQQS